MKFKKKIVIVLFSILVVGCSSYEKRINDSFDKYKIAYNEAELSDFNKQWKVCLKNNFKDSTIKLIWVLLVIFCLSLEVFYIS